MKTARPYAMDIGLLVWQFGGDTCLILPILIEQYSMKLAYVSGRDLDLMLKAIKEYDLLEPDVIVADVGSSIYFPDKNGWQNSSAWEHTIFGDWNGFNSEQIKERLAGFEFLQEQEAVQTSLYCIRRCDVCWRQGE